MLKFPLKKIFTNIFCLATITVISSCATYDETPIGETQSEWDFDHKLQYKKTKFDDNHYRLEVVTSQKVNFARMSAFLLRRSYLICGGDYGYKLTLIKGVESYDYKRASPNKIRTNLTANLECPAKDKAKG